MSAMDPPQEALQRMRSFTGANFQSTVSKYESYDKYDEDVTTICHDSPKLAA